MRDNMSKCTNTQEFKTNTFNMVKFMPNKSLIIIFNFVFERFKLLKPKILSKIIHLSYGYCKKNRS